MSANGLTDALVELAGSTVVVDLSDLTFMDSSGIGALVRARNRIRADGRGQLALLRGRNSLCLGGETQDDVTSFTRPAQVERR